jgi:protein-tyrosine-phosphatase
MSNPQSNETTVNEFVDTRSNVFLMIKFSNESLYKTITETIQNTLDQYSLRMFRADYSNYDDTLWENVKRYMEGSKYGIAIFDNIEEKGINPNVCIELGYMLGQYKRCLILKEKNIDKLPVDLSGRLYKEFDADNLEATIQHQVEIWLQDDLKIIPPKDSKLLLYVSHGGTCRCAMAKAITRKLLAERFPQYQIQVENIAYANPNLTGASKNAQEQMEIMFNENLLADHRTMKQSPRLLADADLILVVASSLTKLMPPEKTYVLKPFLGSEGDVTDPWPDDDTPEAKQRYNACADELYEIISNNLERIVQYLYPSSGNN